MQSTLLQMSRNVFDCHFLFQLCTLSVRSMICKSRCHSSGKEERYIQRMSMRHASAPKRSGVMDDNVVSKRNSFIRYASPETLLVLHRPVSHPCMVGNELITGANNTLHDASPQNYSRGYRYCVVGTIPSIEVIDIENVYRRWSCSEEVCKRLYMNLHEHGTVKPLAS